MADLADRTEAYRTIAKSALSEEHKAQARARYEHQAKAAFIESEKQRRSQSRLHSALGPAISLGGHAINSAMLGHLPDLAGAIQNPLGLKGSPDTQAKEAEFRTELEARSELDPKASTVGSIGGLFTGPARAVATGSASAATRLLGTQALVARTSTNPSVAARLASNTANATVAGTAATAGLIATENREEENYDAVQRLNDIVKFSTSPLALGGNAIAGGIGARAQRVFDTTNLAGAERQRLFKWFRDKTGEELPPDFLTGSDSLKRFFSTIKVTPGFIGPVRRYLDRVVFGGLRDTVLNMRGKATAAQQDARAARVLTEVTGRNAGVGVSRASAEATKARQGVNATLDRTQIIPEGPRAVALQAVVARLKKRRLARAEGKLSPKMKEVLSLMKPLLRGKDRLPKEAPAQNIRAFAAQQAAARRGIPVQMSIKDGDDLIASLDKIAQWQKYGGDIISDADVRMAKDLRATIVALQNATDPHNRVVRESAKYFHSIEDALEKQQIGGNAVDAKKVNDFLNSSNIGDEMAAFEASATPQQLEAVRGAYLARFVEHLASGANPQNRPTGLSLAKYNAAMKADKTGQFSASTFDRVMGPRGPALREEMRNIAQITGEVEAVFGPAAGTSIAGSAATLALVAGSPAAGATLGHQLLSNPGGVAGFTLGAVGVRMFILSLMQGRVGRLINSVNTGDPSSVLPSLIGSVQPARIEVDKRLPGLLQGPDIISQETSQ